MNVVDININNYSLIERLMDDKILPFDLAAIMSDLGDSSVLDTLKNLPLGEHTITAGINFPKGSVMKFDVIFYVVDNLLDGYEATLLKNNKVIRTWVVGPGVHLIDKRVDE